MTVVYQRACMLLLPLLLLLSGYSVSGTGDYFKALEEELKSLKDRLSARTVSGDFEYGKDGPKAVSIHCPCKESPVVSVKDLEIAGTHREECLQVKISGANFEFSFSVNCDGESASKNMRSSSGDSDSFDADASADDIEIEPDL